MYLLIKKNIVSKEILSTNYKFNSFFCQVQLHNGVHEDSRVNN